jgi:hypothetical protein
MMKLADEVQAQQFRQPASPWTDAQSTESERLKRVLRSERDFWYFDRTYFPPEMHTSYAKPGTEHKNLLKYFFCANQLHVVAGFRKLAKTAYSKKILTWLLLTGRKHFIGTLAETLIPTSRNILRDVINLITDNPRIAADFKVQVLEQNADQFAFRVGSTKEQLKKIRYGQAFSEERSVRGASREFGRPEILLVDDLETVASSLGREQVDRRIRILAEAHQSLGDGGTTIVLCNIFDERSAMNRIKHDAEHGLLPANWHMHIVPAWDGKHSGWHNMYPATSEEEMRAMMQPLDESDWQGNYQQNPVPPEGIVFIRDMYREDDVPHDARGVQYCDPNLAIKSKGDTTAMLSFVYSPSKDCYYVQQARCKSYSDSNQLLEDFLLLKRSNVRRLGFDGHVSQESTWTNHVRNYCRIKLVPVPPIIYCRYRVDDCAKNLQLAYNEGRVKFAIGFASTEEGKKFLAQLFSFAGKKSNGKDDAPDALICAFEFIHEQHLVPRKGASFAIGHVQVPAVYDTDLI